MIKLKEYLPERLRQNPVWEALADAFEKVVHKDIQIQVARMMRLRRPELPIRSKVIAVQGEPVKRFRITAKYPIQPLTVSVTNGSTTLQDDGTVQALEELTVDYENGIIEAAFAEPQEHGTTITANWQDVTAIDEPLLHELRRTLGLFIDVSGFGTTNIPGTDVQKRREQALRRLVAGIPEFYNISGTADFIKFLSYTADAQFELEELYSYVNEYSQSLPASVTTWTAIAPVIKSSFVATLPDGRVIQDDGNGRLIGAVDTTAKNTIDYDTGEVTVSFASPVPGANDLINYKYHNADYNGFFEKAGGKLTHEGGVWYKTSHVNLYNDRSRFNTNREQTAKLFYQLAPIQLVLEFIGEIERAEAVLRIQSAAHITSRLIVNPITTNDGLIRFDGAAQGSLSKLDPSAISVQFRLASPYTPAATQTAPQGILKHTQSPETYLTSAVTGNQARFLLEIDPVAVSSFEFNEVAVYDGAQLIAIAVLSANHTHRQQDLANVDFGTTTKVRINLTVGSNHARQVFDFSTIRTTSQYAPVTPIAGTATSVLNVLSFPGFFVEFLTNGTKIKVSDGTTTSYLPVLSSRYSGGATLVTVYGNHGFAPNTAVTAQWSVFSPNNGAIPAPAIWLMQNDISGTWIIPDDINILSAHTSISGTVTPGSNTAWEVL